MDVDSDLALELTARGFVLDETIELGRPAIFLCLDDNHGSVSGRSIGYAWKARWGSSWEAWIRGRGMPQTSGDKLISDRAPDAAAALRLVMDNVQYADALASAETGTHTYVVDFQDPEIARWFGELGWPLHNTVLDGGRVRFTAKAIAYFRGMPRQRGTYVDGDVFNHHHIAYPLIPEAATTDAQVRRGGLFKGRRGSSR